MGSIAQRTERDAGSGPTRVREPSPSLSLDAGETERCETLFQIIAQQRHAEKILGGPVVVRAPRLGDRLGPLLGREAAAAHPGKRHELDLLVLVQGIDEGLELLLDRVVGKILEHLPHVLVDRVGARLLLDRCGLGVELAGLEDHPADLVQIDRRHGVLPQLVRTCCHATAGTTTTRTFTTVSSARGSAPLLG